MDGSLMNWISAFLAEAESRNEQSRIDRAARILHGRPLNVFEDQKPDANGYFYPDCRWKTTRQWAAEVVKALL